MNISGLLNLNNQKIILKETGIFGKKVRMVQSQITGKASLKVQRGKKMTLQKNTTFTCLLKNSQI